MNKCSQVFKGLLVISSTSAVSYYLFNKYIKNESNINNDKILEL